MKAIEKDPNNYAAHIYLGWILTHVGAFEDAARHLHKSLELSPDNPDALYGLGILNYHINDLDPASARLKKAIQISPQSRYHEMLGFVYLKQGDLTSAKGEFLNAINLKSSFSNYYNRHSLVYLILSYIEFRQNDPDEAREMLDNALEASRNVASLDITYPDFVRCMENSGYEYNVENAATCIEETREFLKSNNQQ